MYKIKNTKKTKIKPGQLIIIALVMLAIAGGLTFLYVQHKDSAVKKTPTVSQGSKLNLDPPSDRDKQAAEDNKQAIVDDSKTPPVTGSTTQPVNLFITDASQYDTVIEVRAYTPDAYEDDGSCNYLFAKDGKTFTKTQTATKDAKTTYCPTLDVPRSEFSSAGDWSLNLTYSSTAHQGTKQATVTVK